MAPEVYTPDEIAEAAGVPIEDVTRALEFGQAIAFRGFVPQADAVRLVALLKGRLATSEAAERAPMTQATRRRRQILPGLSASGVAHALILAAIVFISSSALFSNEDVKTPTKSLPPAKLVFLISPGPGGGGGGSGLRKPTPPPLARRAPERPKLVAKVASPVPPVRRIVPPRPQPITRPPVVPPIEPPRIEPVKTEPLPPAPPAVQAPVVSAPADPVDVPGVQSGRPDVTTAGGSGTGGLSGTGRGAGMGEGDGPGIGPGSGGGTGGGPYRPGSGIEPPRLVREVRANYTDDARRRGLEGDVVLEIVVTRSGSVDRVRVVRGLGAGLDQNAIAAVRQWKFEPAKRLGAAVDVVVEVSVEFRMR